MKFRELLQNAKDNKEFAISHIAEMYQPLLAKESIVNGAFDEDLYQELCMTMLHCIDKFKFI